MLTPYSAYRVQTETEPLSQRLGGEERLKDGCRKPSVDAHAVIPDLHKRHFSPRSGGHLKRALSVRRIDGVLDECCPHLTQLPSVSGNRRHQRVVVPQHLHLLQLRM